MGSEQEITKKVCIKCNTQIPISDFDTKYIHECKNCKIEIDSILDIPNRIHIDINRHPEKHDQKLYDKYNQMFKDGFGFSKKIVELIYYHELSINDDPQYFTNNLPDNLDFNNWQFCNSCIRYKPISCFYRNQNICIRCHDLKRAVWAIEKHKDIQQRRLKREKVDPSLKLKRIVSRHIARYLKVYSNQFKTCPTWNMLPYTPQELRDYIESLWEPWMNWDNYGTANRTRRTWNIDHIIPQSKLLYDSMDHPNFLKCWSLLNLRPLDARMNSSKNIYVH